MAAGVHQQRALQLLLAPPRVALPCRPTARLVAAGCLAATGRAPIALPPELRVVDRPTTRAAGWLMRGSPARPCIFSAPRLVVIGKEGRRWLTGPRCSSS